MKRKGSLDADGCHMGYAKPGQAASLNFFDLPAGPRSYDDIFDWPVDIATRAREMVQASGSSGLPTLKVVMTTAYSGIGMAELAGGMLCQGCSAGHRCPCRAGVLCCLRDQ